MMDHWKQLGLPVALGLLAAALNWYSVSSKLQPTAFVGVNQHVSPGDTITRQMLTKLEINGDHGLAQAALPWEQRSILLEWRATRRLQKGSLVLRRDVTPDRAGVSPDEHEFTISVGNLDAPPDLFEESYVSFALSDNDRFHGIPQAPGVFGADTDADKFVGPFRVVGITYQASKEATTVGTPRVDRLTLVVSKSPDGREQLECLLRALHRDGGKQVLAIVRETEASGATATLLDETDVASTWEG